MPTRLTEEDGRRALSDHVVQKATEARARYGGTIDHDMILLMLTDREVVRYPVRIEFAAERLQDEEFAYAHQVGEHPREGFKLFVHPRFRNRYDLLPLLIAYHIVRINYGEIATHIEAELYGATLLGLSPDEYYEALCQIVDGAGLSTSCPGGTS